MIIVAHRLSTVKDADAIVVFGKNGEICDVGKHKELLERCAVYENLVKRQLSDGKKPIDANEEML